ncbi:MAG TPA: HAD family phosphatase [Phycisphaerales bacterium]|nr:HAD family phosphatase [Phycisphaerales bacterium]
MPAVYRPGRPVTATVTGMKAIIFDFDGVIADSEPAHERAIRAAAESKAMTVTHDLYLTQIIGLDDRDTFRVIAEANGRSLDDVELNELTGKKQRLFVDLVQAGEVYAFPGSVELVLSAADRVPIAVCSGAVRLEVELILDRLKIRDRFRCIVTADDVLSAKPDPTGYLMTAERLGCPARECVVIEDTARGIQAGKAAGMRVAAVGHSLPAGQLSQADLFVPRIGDLSVDRLAAIASKTP